MVQGLPAPSPNHASQKQPLILARRQPRLQRPEPTHAGVIRSRLFPPTPLWLQLVSGPSLFAARAFRARL